MTVESKHPETMLLHAGHRADPTTGSVAVPIHQTTSYQFQDAGHASRLFALEELGFIYTRIMNPTQDALEQRLTAMEGGAAALAVASGQAASHMSLFNLAWSGDNVVSSTDLYGGTWNLFANTLKQQGIECRFVDPADPEAFRKATDDRTRAYYAETLPNPKLQVFPIAEVAALGRVRDRRFGHRGHHQQRQQEASEEATAHPPTHQAVHLGPLASEVVAAVGMEKGDVLSPKLSTSSMPSMWSPLRRTSAIGVPSGAFTCMPPFGSRPFAPPARKSGHRLWLWRLESPMGDPHTTSVLSRRWVSPSVIPWSFSKK